MNILTNFKRFLKSFVYAFNGIISCLKTERNMRVHFCAAFYVLIFMQFYDLSKGESAIIYITIGCVIAMEIINTAIEAVVDLCSPDFNELAMLAKDLASAAVLCMAAVAIAVGVRMFWDIAVFKHIYEYFIVHPFALVALLISLVLWFVFIFSIKKTSKQIKK